MTERTRTRLSFLERPLSEDVLLEDVVCLDDSK